MRSSDYWGDFIFYFRMLAKNDFVFADGFVVILPAMLGAPGFLVTTFL